MADQAEPFFANQPLAALPDPRAASLDAPVLLDLGHTVEAGQAPPALLQFCRTLTDGPVQSADRAQRPA